VGVALASAPHPSPSPTETPMGFRFRRSVRLFPGVRLNFGKRGVSASVGIRGAHVTVGRTGVRTTVGIPGTGVSYTNFRPLKRPPRTVRRPGAAADPWQSRDSAPGDRSGGYWLLGWVAGTIAGCILLASFFPTLPADLAIAIWGPALAAIMWTAHRVDRVVGRAAAGRADLRAQLDAERRYTEQTGFPIVHPPSEDAPGTTPRD
jgi:uncharacterized protein DUF4236